jgi:hypothetical protein
MTRTSHQATGAILACNLTALLGSLLLLTSPHAMSPLFCHGLIISHGWHTVQLPSLKCNRSNKVFLLSAPQSNDKDDDLTRAKDAMNTPMSVVAPTTRPSSLIEPEKSSYPIDLPSPLLLASSMILAIVGVGKITMDLSLFRVDYAAFLAANMTSSPPVPLLCCHLLCHCMSSCGMIEWFDRLGLRSHRHLLYTGSGFDLANSTPRFGFGATFSVATVSLTLCAGLFYASILKAQAETEADDKEYMKGK